MGNNNPPSKQEDIHKFMHFYINHFKQEATATNTASKHKQNTEKHKSKQHKATKLMQTQEQHRANKNKFSERQS